MVTDGSPAGGCDRSADGMGIAPMACNGGLKVYSDTGGDTSNTRSIKVAGAMGHGGDGGERQAQVVIDNFGLRE